MSSYLETVQKSQPSSAGHSRTPPEELTSTRDYAVSLFLSAICRCSFGLLHLRPAFVLLQRNAPLRPTGLLGLTIANVTSMSVVAASLEVQSLPTAKADILPQREDSPPSESLVGQPLLAPLEPIVFVRGTEPTLRATLCDKYQPVNPLRPINGAEEPVRMTLSNISRPISNLTTETIHRSTTSSFPRKVHACVESGSSACTKYPYQLLGAIEGSQNVGHSCSGLEMA